jgi:hypothetical protein
MPLEKLVDKKSALGGLIEYFASYSPWCIVAASSHAEVRHFPGQARFRRRVCVLLVLYFLKFLYFLDLLTVVCLHSPC